MLAFSLVLLTVEHVPVLHSLCLMCFSLCYGWLSPSGVLFLLPQPIFISVASSRHQCVVSRLLGGFMPRRGYITLISWTLLDILNNDLLGPVWQSLTCYCRQRFAGPCLAIVDLLLLSSSSSSSPSSSFTFPSVSSSVIGVFHFLPWFPLCCYILVSLV